MQRMELLISYLLLNAGFLSIAEFDKMELTFFVFRRCDPMVTILDIAKAAGVSHGTVSNVLNGKGNVSSKKMELVLKAAEELGYNLNNNAKLLRSGKSQTIIMILPTLSLNEYAAIYESALKEADSQ